MGILSDQTTPALVVDLTDVTRHITIRRGRNITRDTYEAGNATIRVYDPNGDFNPQNPSSPYYGRLTPLRKLRVSVSCPAACPVIVVTAAKLNNLKASVALMST